MNKTRPTRRYKDAPFQPVLITLTLDVLEAADEKLFGINQIRRAQKRRKVDRGQFVDDAIRFFLDSDMPNTYIHTEVDS